MNFKQCSDPSHHIKISPDPMAVDVLTKIPWRNEEAQIALYCNVKTLMKGCDIFVTPIQTGLKIVLKKDELHFLCEAHLIERE